MITDNRIRCETIEFRCKDNRIFDWFQATYKECIGWIDNIIISFDRWEEAKFEEFREREHFCYLMVFLVIFLWTTHLIGKSREWTGLLQSELKRFLVKNDPLCVSTPNFFVFYEIWWKFTYKARTNSLLLRIMQYTVCSIGLFHF